MHYFTPKNDVSLAKEFQKHLSKDGRRHGVIDKQKDRKISSKRKWTDREYHVQDYDAVAYIFVIIFCDINQFPTD